MDLKSKELEVKAADVKLDADNRAQDRESRERVAMAKIIQDTITNPEGLAVAAPLINPDFVRKLEEPG